MLPRKYQRRITPDGFIQMPSEATMDFQPALKNSLMPSSAMQSQAPNHQRMYGPAQRLTSATQITSGMEGEAYEDFDFNDLNGLTELKAALDAFNAANEDKISYSPDYKRAVILTKTP